MRSNDSDSWVKTPGTPKTCSARQVTLKQKFTADTSNRAICWNNLFPLTQMLQVPSFAFSDPLQRRAGSPGNINQQNVSEVHGYVSPWWPNTVQPQKLKQMTAFQANLSESSFWTLATGFSLAWSPETLKSRMHQLNWKQFCRNTSCVCSRT